MDGAAGVFPDHVRHGSGPGAGAQASGLEKQAAIQGGARRDIKALAALGETGFLKIIAVTHTGITADDFTKIVADWINTARHPRFDHLYTELVYQPMLELLIFLRANSFKTFIVSGGGIEFMRVFTERVYGIPPETSRSWVLGGSCATRYSLTLHGSRPNWRSARASA